MFLLPLLGVVFVGILGDDASKIGKQLQAALGDAQVERLAVPTPALRSLSKHSDTSRELVQKLHVDGVIGGELIAAKGKLILRLVIYDANGRLASLSEIPLSGRTLSADELEVLQSNVGDEVGSLTRAAQARKPVAAPKPEPKPVAAAPKPEPKPVAAAKPARTVAIADPFAEPEPAAKSKPDPAPAAPPKPIKPPALKVVEPTPDPAPAHAAAPTEVADASDTVRPEELEAAMAGATEAAVGEVTATNAATLHIRTAIGLGVTSRLFSPGPTTVPGYAAAAVGAVRFDAHVQPTRRLGIGVVAERTLAMSTPMAGGDASTTISRWEATSSFSLTTGSLEIAPQLGFGRRSFTIDSIDPSRTPDGEYNYLIIGAAASRPLGSRLSLRANIAFEPVVSGSEPTEMAFGEASRWAFDIGAQVEAQLTTHLFARASADYQRFTWSWESAGARGAGGAVDGYPSATLSIGADY
jgi:hypothetical protein